MKLTAIGISTDSFGVSDTTSEIFELPLPEQTNLVTAGPDVDSEMRRQAAEYVLKSYGQYSRILVLSVLDGFPILVDDFAPVFSR